MSISIHKPAGLLSQYIKQYWILDGSCISNAMNSMRIVPSGLLEIYFPLRESINYSNQFGTNHTKPFILGQYSKSFDVSVSQNCKFVAVTLLPLGAYLLGETPTATLTDGCAALSDFTKVKIEKLEENLLKAKTNDEAFTILNIFFEKLITNTTNSFSLERIQHSLQLLHRNHNISIQDLAQEVCLSKKQFERTFSESIGLSPKAFAKIVRFQKAIFLKQNQPDCSLTSIAYNADYYDQSHMTNEFKSLSGYTPKQFFKNSDCYSDYFSE